MTMGLHRVGIRFCDSYNIDMALKVNRQGGSPEGGR